MYKVIKKRKVSFGYHSKYPNTWFFRIRGLAGKRHGAWDYACPTGTQVHAPERMQVHQVRAWNTRYGYGRFIRAISLEDKVTEYIFAHLDVVPYPRVGKIWQANEVIAWSGNSGTSTNPHLHFEVRRRGKKINPAKLYG